MTVAKSYAERSTCDRNHVGAVVAIDGRILMTGYNGTPAGMPHCDHRCVCPQPNPLDVGYEDDEHLDECPYDKPCSKAVHAEANAIAFAAKNGLCTADADLFVTLSPCYECAKLIINAGLRRVVYGRPYRDESGLRLLEAAGVYVELMR